MRQTVYMMTGPAGAGKSTVASVLSKETGAVILSSDAIRGELYGDESIQGNPAEVFGLLYNRGREYLAKGRDIIIDATNVTRKIRSRNFKAFGNNVFYVAYIVKPPLDVALSQNKSRDRHVPEDVIVDMYRKYQEPRIEEGFDMIVEWG